MATLLRYTLLLTLLLFFMPLFIVCLRPSADNNTTRVKQRWCIEEERVALLALKQSFKDPHHRLSSWQGPDCCSWLGVTCHKFTRRVLELDLRATLHGDYFIMEGSEGIYFPLNPLETGELNPSLVKLKYLKYLDLSGNLFNFSSIPHFLGHMKQLTYLNLSYTDFSGLVPHHLGNLSSLEVLDLRINGWGDSSPIYVDDFSWVSGLSSLQYLDMGGVDLQRARNLAQVLNHLPSLLHLGLFNCRLMYHNLFTTTPSINSTIQHLDLSWNFFDGPIHDFLQNMTSLQFLDLHANYLNSSNPLWLGNLKSLVHLDLAYNNFKSIGGGLWLVLQNLCHLKSLDLSWNMFNGESVTSHQVNMSVCSGYDLETISLDYNEFRGYLPEWLCVLENLKELHAASNSFHGFIPPAFEKLTSLRELDLSNNKLSGTIPSFLGGFAALETLDLAHNYLNGTIPTIFGELRVLRRLDLSHNQLNGVIPECVGQLVNLEVLDISSNSLNGLVSSEYHLANLFSLKHLSIGSNHMIRVKIDSNWVPPFQLSYIGMPSCSFENREFPNWLWTQKQARIIDLSNASISGTMPPWLLQDMPNITELDLSHNQIKGPIPNFTNGRLEQVLLVDNLLNGSVPNSFCDMESLIYLDLSKNMLSGHIPKCWKRSQQLFSINLSSNKLTGPIPSSLGNLESLGWLLLSKNSLKGHLPLGLSNCRIMLVLDVGDNELCGNIPTWIGDNINYLQLLKLGNNMFNGLIPSQLCRLSHLQIMDLSHNTLVGEIPGCIGNLTGMAFPRSVGSYLPAEQPIAMTPIVDGPIGMTPTEDGPIAMAPTMIMGYAFPPGSDEEWNKANVRQVMKGRELEYTTVLKSMFNLDLSSNRLVGPIPEQLTLLTRLVGLSLARNQLSGKIPKNTGDLKSLESLDLSENKLWGAIPESLSDIPWLSYMNLSHNNLTGEIPKGNQLQTLADPSFYEGNPQLCGAPLPRCPGSGGGRDQQQQEDEDDDDDDRSERLWFYLVVMLGYATGFWIVIGVLLIKKRWRHAYFQMMEETKDKIYVLLAVKMGAQVPKKKKKIMKNGRQENM